MESSCRISITDGLSPEPLPTPVANEFMADNSTAPTIFPSPKDLSEEAEDFLAGFSRRDPWRVRVRGVRRVGT